LGINRQLERWRDPPAGESKINREERGYLVALLPNFEQRWIPKGAALDSSATRAVRFLLRTAQAEEHGCD
jgi:hypothetical protein